MRDYSYILSIFIAFFALSGLQSSFTSASGTVSSALYDKWEIEYDIIQGPDRQYIQATNTFWLTFGVDDTISSSNINGSIWQEGCEEEGKPLLNVDGIDNIGSIVNATGEGSIYFSLNTTLLANNPDVYTKHPDAPIGEMKMCAKFMLVNDDGDEVNYIETVVTVFFSLEFEVWLYVGDNLRMKDQDPQDVPMFEKGYGVNGYLCDPSNPSVNLTGVTYPQGSVISVCVTPSDEALADGLLLQSIDWFYWARGGIEQEAIESTVQSSNQLTRLECIPGSLYCSFTSVLYADFYRDTAAPSNAPSSVPTYAPPTSAPTEQATICEGVGQTSETLLDFNNATIKQSDLQSGGELRYGDIGIVNGEAVDLLVTAEDYYHPNPLANGKNPSGKFGQIAMRTYEGDLDSGRGVFTFCLVENNTDTPVMAESFQWSVFDIDNRANSPNIHEKLTINTNQTAGYSVMSPNDLDIYCEDDGSEPPCADGVRTVFEGGVSGGGSDNPTDPNDLTDLQKRRSVVFTFTNTSCWTYEFNAYCTGEVEDPPQSCAWYGGSLLLFGGGASQVVAEGETDCTEEEERRNLEEERMTVPVHFDMDEDLHRELSSSNLTALVGGYGQVTLTFLFGSVNSTGTNSTRRRLNRYGRDLQYKGDVVELDVSITTQNDLVGNEWTAGGTSRLLRSGMFPFVLGLFCSTAFLLG